MDASLGGSKGEYGMGGSGPDAPGDRALERLGGWLDIRRRPSAGLSGMLPTGVRRDDRWNPNSELNVRLIDSKGESGRSGLLWFLDDRPGISSRHWRLSGSWKSRAAARCCLSRSARACSSAVSVALDVVRSSAICSRQDSSSCLAAARSGCRSCSSSSRRRQRLAYIVDISISRGSSGERDVCLPHHGPSSASLTLDAGPHPSPFQDWPPW